MSTGPHDPRDEPPASDTRSPRAGRALLLYLVVYYLLIAGAVLTMWRSGLIAYVDRVTVLATLVAAIAAGAALAWLSKR